MAFGFFILPLSEFSYRMKALEKLYLVNSKDPHLVQVKSMQKKNSKTKFRSIKISQPDDISIDVAEIASTHRPIKLSTWNQVKLFCIS